MGRTTTDHTARANGTFGDHTFCAGTLTLVVACLLSSVAIARAGVAPSSPRAVVHLLDYIAQDYGGAVANGKVASEGEFAEMREFSQSAVRLGLESPEISRDPQVIMQLRVLAGLVEKRADAAEVTHQSRQIKSAIIQRTHLAVAPSFWPSLDEGGRLFQQGCAACHGSTGHGDGPSAATITPKPSDFYDATRMRDLSPFQAFNTIQLGVPGTAMPSFGSLRDQEAWALAFYVLSLRHRSADVPGGDRSTSLDLTTAASESDRQIEDRLAESSTDKQRMLAAVRLHSGPADSGHTLSVASKLLREADMAYRSGDYSTARSKALAAYLDGIEPAEARVKAVAPAKAVQLEQRMAAVRSAIEKRRGASEVTATVEAAAATVRQVDSLLNGSPSSPWLVFSMAAAIVLREGFEAILIIVAILSVLRAVGARNATKWVHAGWISALGVGFLAWLVSEWLMKSSGLNRELLEGVTSLVAVVVLLYLGFWLHRRTQIGRWKAFIEDQVHSALNSRRLIGLTMISFLAVFREALETVLFLVALSLEGGPAGRRLMASGVVASLACTILLAWALVKFSARLPLRTIFGVTAVLMMALAIVLVGKGSHSLQEIGALGITGTPFQFRSDLFGVYPTVETLLAQAIIAALSTVLWFRARSSPDASTAS